MLERLNITGKVGLIVRGKTSASHSPGLMDQHADCVLGSGEPVGFYGLANGGRSNSAGLNMNGVVWRFDQLMQNRPYYVDVEIARKYNAVSAILLIPASVAQVKRFAEYWDTLERSPGSFDIVGGNCSTHASVGFIYSGLIKNGIPGLDTPDNLFRQLSAQNSGLARYGYLGFDGGSGLFNVSIDSATSADPVTTGTSNRARLAQSQSSGVPSSLNSSNTGSRVTANSFTSRR